jgi:ankyrin repeat protein
LVYRRPNAAQGAGNTSLQTALISAARAKKAGIVESLLDRGVSPDTGEENNVIIIAVGNEDLPTLKVLLEFGGNPDSTHKGLPALSSACKGRLELARILLDWGADPNLSDNTWSPLCRALDDNQINMVKLLLRYGASPTMSSREGHMPLVYACTHNTDAAVIEEILLWKPDVNCQDTRGNTPLEVACSKPHIDAVRLFLTHGANPNMRGKELPICVALRNIEVLKLLIQHGAEVPKGMGIMELAVREGTLETVKLLLEGGADVNERAGNNDTPLSCAIRRDKLELVQLLLQAGANPNEFTNKDRMPLALALQKPEIFKALIAHGADPKHFPGLLEWAVWKDSMEVVRVLVEQVKVDVNEPFENGNFPLWTAIRDNRMEIFQYLIAHGANVDYRSTDNRDPLLRHALTKPQYLKLLLQAGANPHEPSGLLEWAVYRGNMESVRMLVEEAKVDLNACSLDNGNFPLWIAIRDDRKEIFQYLLAKGANVNYRGIDNRDPLIRHALTKPEYVRQLLQAGANPHEPSGLLEWAVYRGNMETVRILVEEAKLDLNACSPDNGNFPLWIGIRDNRKEIFQYILAKGANPNYRGIDNREPLLWAALTKPEYIRQLLQAGANAHQPPGILEWAVWRGNMESVRILVEEAKVDLNASYENGNWPLWTCVRDNRVEIMKYLLDRGANPNHCFPGHELPLVRAISRENCNDFLRPLHAHGCVTTAVPGVLVIAVHKNNRAAVDTLIDLFKVDINEPNKEGERPLPIAIRYNRPELVQLLLQRGANPNLAGEGLPVVDAADRADPRILEAILKAGANPNAMSPNGNTALCRASYNGHKQNVQLLLDHGANPELANRDGKIAMEIAANRGHEEIVMMLLEKMG